jgi:hypothetical protein
LSDKRDALAGLAFVAAGAAALALVKRLLPPPEPKPWGSAFWLDPDLWDRVPMLPNGRYGRCWDYLDGPVVDGPNLAHSKPPPPPPPAKIGDHKTDYQRNQTLVLTPNGWVPFAYAGIYDNETEDQTRNQYRFQKLWKSVQYHGWVKAGDWDVGVRCEGCWNSHSPGYHPRSYHDNRMPEIWIEKPGFAPWLNWRWNESLKQGLDPRKVEFC